MRETLETRAGDGRNPDEQVPIREIVEREHALVRELLRDIVDEAGVRRDQDAIACRAVELACAEFHSVPGLNRRRIVELGRAQQLLDARRAVWIQRCADAALQVDRCRAPGSREGDGPGEDLGCGRAVRLFERDAELRAAHRSHADRRADAVTTRGPIKRRDLGLQPALFYVDAIVDRAGEQEPAQFADPDPTLRGDHHLRAIGENECREAVAGRRHLSALADDRAA
ncbi:hypothetical protein PIB19_19355 [Sphingomonas sp. 7/4-4]|nr:hypothetical protein [Sphingomonas sp. 7/4-4]WBY07475.1 hypothetical protein PIB19_19355 [Sphingomonas sp. 7/4-4]